MTFQGGWCLSQMGFGTACFAGMTEGKTGMAELLPAITGNPQGQPVPEAAGKDVTGARRVCYVPSDSNPLFPLPDTQRQEAP